MLKGNPILKKDLKVTSRSMRLSWGITAYEGIILLILIFSLNIFENLSTSFYDAENYYSRLVTLFPILSIAQIVIVGLIIPIMTASSISGEKERQTFDIMLTTSMTPFAIIAGKLFSAVSRVLLFVLASIPLMSIAFIYGGMSWLTLLYFLIAVTLYACFAGSIGILSSTICRKSITAIILSYAINFVIYALTFIPMAVADMVTRGSSMYDFPLLLLINPVMFFEEFYAWVITGSFEDSLMNQMLNSYVGPFTGLLARGGTWMFVSGFVILGITILFMLWSARRINPLHGRKK